MKIKLLVEIFKDGKMYAEGETMNVDENKAELWIAKKWCKAISNKEHKPKKETKELKLDSKETKDEAN